MVELRVWARDNGDPRRECAVPASVSISIRKVNASPLAFPEPFYETTLFLPTVVGVKVACVSVAESYASSDEVSDAATGQRLPQQPLKYSVVDGNEENRFRLDPSDGCLFVSNHVDLVPVYNLTVNASDGRKEPASTRVTIHVRDLPKGALKFTKDTYWANILENTTNERNLLAVNVRGLPLNAHVKYSLLNADDYFEIRPTSGVLKTTGKPFDWEKRDHFALIVRVNI